MNNNIILRIKANMGNLVGVTKNTDKSLQSLHQTTQKATSGFNKFQQSNRKLNNSLSNLNKDSNRARGSLNSLSSGMGVLQKAIMAVNVYALGKGITHAINANIEMIETINLYNNAMGMFAESTDKAIQSLSDFTGLDKTNTQNKVGTYNLLARSMGITSENASILSENINRLSLDLSSLTNTSIQQVSEDLKSGLIGQSRTLYKYGIDATEAGIATEALAQGITKSVRNMTQGEKMVLRYSIIIRQAGLSHGDFARTIETPANQLKILSERFVTLSRAIGAVFIPMLQAVLPYINALVMVLTKLFTMLARVIGYVSGKEVKNIDNDNFLGIPDGTDKAEKGVKKTGKAIKKLKGQLMGFDEINLWKEPEDPSSGGKSNKDDGGGSSPFDMELPTLENVFKNMKTKSDRIAEEIKQKLHDFVKYIEPVTTAFSTLWNEGLAQFKNFTFGTILDFYELFLKPMSDWTVGKGLKDFFDITNAMANNINWNGLQFALRDLYEELVPLGKFVGQGLLDFYEYLLVPLSVWVMNDGFPHFVKLTKEGLANINFDKINSGLIKLWNSLVPLGKFVGNGLLLWYEKVLIPLSDWVMNVALIELLDIFTNGFENINFTKIIDSFSKLWDVTTPFSIKVGEGLLWLLEKVLVPLGLWTINDVLPLFLKSMTNGLKLFSAILDIFAPLGKWLLENFLIPIAKWTGGVVIDKLNKLSDIIGIIGDWASNHGEFITQVITDMGIAFASWLVISALTNPIGQLILIMGSVIAACELLKLAWDLVKTSGKEAWESLVEIWHNTQDWFSDNVLTPIQNTFDKAHQAVVDWVDKKVRPYFTWEKWSEILQGVVDSFKDIFDMIIGDNIKSINNWIIEHIMPWFTITKWKEILKGTYTSFKETFSSSFSDTYQLLTDWVSDKIIPWFTLSKWIDIMKGSGKAIVQTFENSINASVKLFNTFIDWLNDKMEFKWNDFKIAGKTIIQEGSFQLFTIPHIPQLADGGIVDAGQAFIAREAGPELVGSHNGKTGVMNNDQIVQAVSEGVYGAVTSAMKISQAGNSSGEKELIINLDGKEMGRVLLPKMNNESRRLGYQPILNYK